MEELLKESIMSTTNDKQGPDTNDGLPLRWGVILAIAVGLGILGTFFGGPLAGLTVGLAACGLLFQILGR
ncbi:hypothetical protein BJF78_36060 [Pseudonocardia sp. CNS-139]|nr:hypothetical protein BJF78_36060 [Pseudonocardia sp. CNS-139]